MYFFLFHITIMRAFILHPTLISLVFPVPLAPQLPDL